MTGPISLSPLHVLRAQDVMVTIAKTLPEGALVKAARAQLDDDHVHMVLVVDAVGRLLTTIERSDLPNARADEGRAASIGELNGRATHPLTPLTAIMRELDRSGRRRLAVVDNRGRLLGLVCRKRNGTGFCTNQGVRARLDERAGFPQRDLAGGLGVSPSEAIDFI